MNRFGLILIFSATLIFEALLLFSSCSPKTMSASNDEQNKEPPSSVSLSPSSFLCEAKVIGLDSLRSTILIRKIIQQGAALFYSVGIGDTIQAKIYTYQRNNLSIDSITELVIEERLKINSEIPDFIIRQIISEKK